MRCTTEAREEKPIRDPSFSVVAQSEVRVSVSLASYRSLHA